MAFSRLSNLERFKLQSNQLTNIRPDHFFSSMTKLVAIDLQRNQLTDIPSQYPSLLRELELGNNQLTHFPMINDTFQHLSQLVTLDLSSNPLRCDCHLKSVYQWLLTHFQSELVPYVQWICATPSSLAGKKLGSLKELDFVCDNTAQTSEATQTTIEYVHSIDGMCVCVCVCVCESDCSLEHSCCFCLVRIRRSMFG
jgi:slit 2